MVFFEDISNFNKIEDYLPILIGCTNADLILLTLTVYNVMVSSYFKTWFKTFYFSACIWDVLIIFMVIAAARYTYNWIFRSFNIIYFTLY